MNPPSPLTPPDTGPPHPEADTRGARRRAHRRKARPFPALGAGFRASPISSSRARSRRSDAAPPTRAADLDHRPGPADTSRFRVDVQALRAIAVLGVFAFHLWPQQVPGGFTGVDVFFVISGYLITRQLLSEIETHGRIRLLDFWARRIRRLLPAAALVLVVSLAILAVLMPTVTWRGNAEEIAASALYVENWLLGRNAVDYLAAENAPSLAQHYWSLSVEEQFYAIWPLLLLIPMMLLRTVRTGSRARRRTFLVVLVAVALVSFAISLTGTASNPAMTFYATHARAWQFAVGGLLCLLPTLAAWPHMSRIAAWMGLAIIAAGLFLIDGATVAYPGYAALLPTLGTALVIGAAVPSGPGSPLGVLGRPAVQRLGDLSYAIYLWHWPLVIAAPWVLGGHPGLPAQLVLVALTVGLAVATKRYVEDPARTSTWWRARTVRSYAFAPTAMAIVAGIGTTWILGIDQRYADMSASAHQKARTQARCFGAFAMTDPDCGDPYTRSEDLDPGFGAVDHDPARDACQQTTRRDDLILCDNGTRTDPDRIVVVVGNSHALRLIPPLAEYGRTRGWKVVLAAKSDCLGLSSTLPGVRPSCREWTSRLHAQLAALPRLDAVVFPSYAGAARLLTGTETPSPDAEAQARDAVLETWQTLSRRGTAIVVPQDVPGTRPDDAPRCIAASSAPRDPCARARSDLVLDNLTFDLAKRHPDKATPVPMEQFFCGDQSCHAVIGGVVVYSDAHHITETFGLTLAPYLGRHVDDAMRAAGRRSDATRS